jgi:hypothetical protein
MDDHGKQQSPTNNSSMLVSLLMIIDSVEMSRRTLFAGGAPKLPAVRLGHTRFAVDGARLREFD